MDTEEIKSQEEVTINNDVKPWLFKPGNPGGPGRPKGSVSIKDLVRQHLENNPEDLREFVTHFIKKNRELAWQMLEGKPQQDIVSDGKQLPTPIYIPRDDSPKEDSGTE